MTTKAITFDYWNTLVRATDEQANWRMTSWVDRLAAAGIAADAGVIRDAFTAEWRLHHEGWMTGVIYNGTHAANGAVDRVAAALDVSLEVMRADLVHSFLTEGENAEFETCPGVDEVLPLLAERGVRVGIICDVGFTPSTGLRRLLERFGLLQHFTGWSFSDEVGHYKPDPRIFEHALGYLETDPSTTAHIGDIRRTDVVGARGMGMTAIRYKAVSDDTNDEHPEGHYVIDHHAQLLDILELT